MGEKVRDQEGLVLVEIAVVKDEQELGSLAVESQPEPTYKTVFWDDKLYNIEVNSVDGILLILALGKNAGM